MFLGSVVVQLPLLFILSWTILIPNVAAASGRKFNILHIIADDLRTELGAYRAEPDIFPKIHTPNIDAFAETGTRFTNAFVNGVYCNPSRASFLTSRRPETTRIGNLQDIFAFFRDKNNLTTMPQYLKSIGFETRSVGKVFHNLPTLVPRGGDDNQYSWSQPAYQPPNYGHYFNFSLPNSFVVQDNETTCDDLIATEACRILKEFSQQDKPLYLAVGFYRPHVPFWATQRLFDLYPESEVDLPAFPFVPEGYPQIAWMGLQEMLLYKGAQEIIQSEGMSVPNLFKHELVPYNYTLPDDIIKRYRRAYYAAVSGVDELFGHVLQAIRDQHMEHNTIVIFQSDHGYLLDEHRQWCKIYPFDLVTRVPFIIRVPGMKQNKIVTSLVELVDVFPTVVDLLGLPKLETCPKENSGDVPLCTEGMSFRDLIEQSSFSSSEEAITWDKPAFSSMYFPEATPSYMWYSVRNDRYRYVRYMSYNLTTYSPYFDELQGEELYDHTVDAHENVNVADDKKYRNVKKKMVKILEDGWRQYIH